MFDFSKANIEIKISVLMFKKSRFQQELRNVLHNITQPKSRFLFLPRIATRVDGIDIMKESASSSIYLPRNNKIWNEVKKELS